MSDWRWYLTIAAVREWMTLTGRNGPLENNNPAFLAAQSELGELSLTARLSEAATARRKFDRGDAVYRGSATVKGKRRRVECIVMPPQVFEGPLPALVRVTLK